ncbi:MAG: hypothetical protein V5B33_07960 [Candidatus Accumulibacter sp. UW20]|jgi:hypothetical protein
MTSTNPYAHLVSFAMQNFKEQETKQKPTLTLISGNERIFMTTPQDEAATEPPAAALGKRVDFAEMEADINFLSLGADALQGIGAMMQPEVDRYDEQLSLTRRSDMAAIFRFFGEALRARAARAGESVERLEYRAERDPV